jgi:hypothetical protein
MRTRTGYAHSRADPADAPVPLASLRREQRSAFS